LLQGNRMTVTSSQQHEILDNGLNLLQRCLSAVLAAALYRLTGRRIGKLPFVLAEPSGLGDPNQPNLEGEVFSS
jgi:hypothetical protein